MYAKDESGQRSIPPSASNRRFADYVISEEAFFLLLQRLKGHWLKIELPDLPADARFRAVHYCFNRGCFVVRFESPAFVPVLEGEPAPIAGELRLELRREGEAEFPAEEAGARLNAEILRINALCDLIAFMGQGLAPGETSADRLAAYQRLAVAVLKRATSGEEIHAALRAALEERVSL